MTTFKLTVNCDSADLHDGHPEALGALLVRLGERIRAGSMPETVLDANGNTVGTVRFDRTDDEEEDE